jgi:hypothetical protein
MVAHIRNRPTTPPIRFIDQGAISFAILRLRRVNQPARSVAVRPGTTGAAKYGIDHAQRKARAGFAREISCCRVREDDEVGWRVSSPDLGQRSLSRALVKS